MKIKLGRSGDRAEALGRRTILALFIASGFIWVLPYSLIAQSGGIFEITGGTIAGGADAMSADDFELDGTLGQPDAGGSIGAGNFALTSGFWNYTALAPTAAGVTVSGRIVTPDGVGISNARIFVQTHDGQIFFTRSASFGYYMFEDIAAGQSIFVTVEHKLFTFEPRTVMVIDSVADLDFTGQPH